MAKNAVIDLQPALQVKHWLGQFDTSLKQLTSRLVSVKQKANTIERLARCLDNATQHGLDPIELQSRTHSLTLLAFEHGYTQEEVEALLTFESTSERTVYCPS